MCGIVGVIGDIQASHEKAFKQMLVFDSVRGEDSTGVLSVKKYEEHEYNISKQVGNPFELFDMERTKKLFYGSHRVLLGHNRWATQGKVNKINAHPFDFETLVGVHNGSLTNKTSLHNGHLYDVDSQALYAHIEAKGVEDALRTARGAFALVWWDKDEQTINFVRNKERPLHFGIAKDHKSMFFASEAWMFEVAAARNSIVLDKVEEFETELLYQIPVVKGGGLGKPVIREVEFSKPYQSNVVFPIRGQQQQQQQSVQSANGQGAVKEGHSQTTTGGSTETTAITAKRSVMDPSFLGQKNVLFEAVCIQKDNHGAEYVVCFAPSHPYLETRIYRHTAAKPIFDNIGCELEGDVTAFVQTEAGRGYYKLSPHNIKMLEGVKVTVLDPAELVPDHKGNDITQTEWIGKYGTCGMCTTEIIPSDLEEGARFTANGECVCKLCAEDKELIKYITLI